MRFTVVTACRNSGRLLEETMRSVLEQTAVKSGKVELEYFVCDGASTDHTRQVVEQIGSPLVQFTSEPDGGMYDALARGLRRAAGDVVCYLNAGDYYHKTAFEVVAEIFANHPEVSWLTGCGVIYNERSQIIDARLPYRYRAGFFTNGIHGRLLPTLQQESTFWRAGLHALLDFERLATLRLAGDYYLWTQFARQHRPRVVGAQLGGFKIHAGQLTEGADSYGPEFRSLIETPGVGDWLLGGLDWVVWKLAPTGLKRRLSPADHFVYDVAAERWRAYSRP